MNNTEVETGVRQRHIGRGNLPEKSRLQAGHYFACTMSNGNYDDADAMVGIFMGLSFRLPDFSGLWRCPGFRAVSLRGKALRGMKTTLGIGALICLQCAVMAQPVQPQRLPGHRPAAAVRLTPVGRLEDARELKLAIGLPLRNKEGLTNLLQRIYDPASPEYHHYLSPAQFAEAFGPTEQDYQAVKAFAIAHGLKVSATHANRALLDVTGAVSNI